MSLTTGRGPLSGRPSGRFTSAVPHPLTYIEPFRRRVRATKDERAVVDSERVLLVHRSGQPPSYAFPADDVVVLPTADEPDIPGYVTVAWEVADAWFEEEEQVFGHPRNPYHRVDCLRSNRRLRVEALGQVLVDTISTMVVYETALEPRLYVDSALVTGGPLEPSGTTTYCPYKGTASYWSARIGADVISDIAWSYQDPLPESAALAGLLSFDDTRVTVRHDLPAAG